MGDEEFDYEVAYRHREAEKARNYELSIFRFTSGVSISSNSFKDSAFTCWYVQCPISSWGHSSSVLRPAPSGSPSPTTSPFGIVNNVPAVTRRSGHVQHAHTAWQKSVPTKVPSISSASCVPRCGRTSGKSTSYAASAHRAAPIASISASGPV